MKIAIIDSENTVLSLINGVESIQTRIRIDGKEEILLNGSVFDTDNCFITLEDSEVISEGDVLPEERVLTSEKEKKIKELDQKCNEVIQAGFTSPTTGYFYGFNYEHQMNMTQQMVLLIGDPSITSVLWKTEDAGVIEHTREQFLSVCKDSATHKTGAISHYWSLKEQVNQSVTREEIYTIAW